MAEMTDDQLIEAHKAAVGPEAHAAAMAAPTTPNQDGSVGEVSDEALIAAHTAAFGHEATAAATAEPPTVEDAARGGWQGFTAGAGDEIHGAVAAGQHIASNLFNGLNAAEIGAVYTKARDDDRALNKVAAERSPIAYNAAELGGSVATAFIPGGLSAKVASKLGTAIALGTTAGINYSEAEDMAGLAEDAAIGAAGGAIGHAAGSLLNKAIGPKVYTKEQLLELHANNMARTIGCNGVADMKKFEALAQSKGQTIYQVADDLSSVVNLQHDANPLALRAALNNERQDVWNKLIQPTHDKIDLHTAGQSVNVTELKGRLTKEIKTGFPTRDADAIQGMVKGMTEDLDIFSSGRPSVSLTELQTLKNMFSKTFNRSSSADAQEVKGAALRAITDMQRDTVYKLGNNLEAYNGQGAKDFYIASMRKYGNLADTENFMASAVARHRMEVTNFGEGNWGLTQRIKRGVYAMSANRGVFSNAAHFVKAAIAGKAADPQFLENTINYSRILKAFNDNPEKYSKIASGVAQASLFGTGEVVKALGYADSSIALENQPIEPTLASLKQNAPKLLNIIEQDHPAHFGTVKAALESNDEGTLAGWMSSARQTPELAKYFKPSLGVDGKIYSDLDRAKALQQTEAMGWSHTQRMQAKERINKYHQVPNFQVPPAPPILAHQIIVHRNAQGKKIQQA